jgi:hypothetical protein
VAFVRKITLNQLQNIDNIIDNENKFDIGEETTKDYPQTIDLNKNNDLEFEKSYDQSNIKMGTFGMGNFGEYFGDVTNNGKYANLLSVHNPLHNKNIPNYEDFDTMFWFGDTWKNRDPNKVQKFDEPDDEMIKNHKKNSLFNENTKKKKIIKENFEFKHIKNFDSFKQK